MNTTHRRRVTVSIILLAAATLVGCSSLDKSYPDKTLYGIDVGQPSAAPAAAVGDPAPARLTSTTDAPVSRADVLQVRRVNISPPFNGLALTYRDHGGRYVSDYYNNWVTPPEELLTSDTIDWLSTAGPFRSVIDGHSTVPHQYALETSITALYGDFQDPHAPKVILRARVFLLNDATATRSIAFQNHYDETVNIPTASADHLATGAGQAYRQMLESLTRDLATLSQTTASRE